MKTGPGDSASPPPCRICDNEVGNRSFPATEMMLGLRDRFEYFECGRCGALQIGRIPADLAPYYAPPYYSFQPPVNAGVVRSWLMQRLAKHALGGRSAIGAALARVHPAPPLIAGIGRRGLGLDARILDVGSGAGQLLVSLRDYGFRNLLGLDAFIDSDREYDGVRIRRASLEQLDETFDLIMFHHSFEHVPDPAQTLRDARERLAEGGSILIATPVASRTWREYGPDWVELDAPRHLHVHTVTSLEFLAKATGLVVDRVVWDSSGFELWGSEQYRRGIPLADPASHGMGGAGKVFSAREMKQFDAQAALLNSTGQAGRATFWLASARTVHGQARTRASEDRSR
ncbi:MAG TPA: class I SAM-dependent methyltransferase [Longimicrobiales bacterium]|nr:class I SAM-dependent methyltransferase [Longimicrobiales bacterium]